MRTTVTMTELIEWRQIPGRTALVYLTDRCPVGCAHCSVNSTATSARVSDHQFLQRIVRDLATKVELHSVGISGGEPFIERTALTQTVDTLTDAGKLVIPYTSAVWANSVPRWVQHVLERSAAVVLSTDTFHDDGVSQEQVRRAMEAIVAAGARLILQVVDVEQSVERALDLVTDCFGASAPDVADVTVVPLIGVGRGTTLVTMRTGMRPDRMQACRAAASAVVAYDGRITPCCNESLINGDGPAALRPLVSDPKEFLSTLDDLTASPLLTMMRTAGPAGVVSLPGFADLGEHTFGSLCDFCWKAHERQTTLSDADSRVLRAAAVIAR
jgi:organic radical activating enzyme